MCEPSVGFIMIDDAVACSANIKTVAVISTLINLFLFFALNSNLHLSIPDFYRM